MNVIQCYAPTNDYNEDAKDQYYDKLQSIVEKCSTKDLTILMGDLNAKVGMDNTGYEDIMGRQGLGERNKNGERFANLCAFNKLVIGGTIFPHKRIHKATWTSPDHTTQNQNDHICINKTFRRTMEDVRTKKGADIASDHHLLVAKMKQKLKKHRTMRRTISQKFNTKGALNTSRTRAEKAKAQAEYTEVNKQVKRSIRTDKRKYVEDLATTAEKAAREGNMRQLYGTTNKLSGNHCTPERPVKSKEGKTKSQLYGSLWNNQLNGIHHSTSTSLTTKKNLTAWTEQHYGKFFDTTACLRR
ncbi:unnamed protein product [Schistosoma margrebowiei]|uniref:Uncharacterized protein n=1 Tax=Schistosoma margrebowiei TaxID=48269 RepID=A0A183LJ09_9TREM|nr:unnamed protein product [Schistosoma margrebowiei]